MIFILFNFTSPIPLKYAFAYQVPSINLRSVSPPDVYTGRPSLCVVSDGVWFKLQLIKILQSSYLYFTLSCALILQFIESDPILPIFHHESIPRLHLHFSLFFSSNVDRFLNSSIKLD